MANSGKTSNVEQDKKNSSPVKKMKPALLIVFIIIAPAIFYFLFFMNSNDVPQDLVGKWGRTDGGYTIEIKEVMDDGTMDAAYFNPNPINVGRAVWKIQDKKVQVYVELRDENYPGSYYNLIFDKESEMLKGDYYQAVAKQTFDVEFNRNK